LDNLEKLMNQKIGVGLGYYFLLKAQCDRIKILHFGSMFSTKKCEPELGHFHQNLVQILQRTKQLL
jgi:hypothetical protein